MSNISTRLNLLAIPGAKKTELEGKGGKKVNVVVIPIEYANLYNGEKGVYLDLVGFPLKQQRENSKDTHLVKQSLPKEKQTDDMPILGSHIDWSFSKSESAPLPEQSISKPMDDPSDLPF